MNNEKPQTTTSVICTNSSPTVFPQSKLGIPQYTYNPYFQISVSSLKLSLSLSEHFLSVLVLSLLYNSG